MLNSAGALQQNYNDVTHDLPERTSVGKSLSTLYTYKFYTYLVGLLKQGRRLGGAEGVGAITPPPAF